MSSSRRKVLKTLGIAAGLSASGLLPQTLLARSSRPALDPSRVLGKKGLDAILLGAGSRGSRVSAFSVESPGSLRIVAVAEPLAARNRAISEQHQLPGTHCFSNWADVFQHPKFADVVVITAPGNYMAPCTAALKAGYDVWVDRPVSLDGPDMEQINALAKRLGRQLLFCYGYPENLSFMDHALVSQPI